MDEEGGRSGPGARQSGPADALPDALVKSLRGPDPRQFKSTFRVDYCVRLAPNPKYQRQGETQ
jgi:hypothetical protein